MMQNSVCPMALAKHARNQLMSNTTYWASVSKYCSAIQQQEQKATGITFYKILDREERNK
jgi:hypothetical protein